MRKKWKKLEHIQLINGKTDVAPRCELANEHIGIRGISLSALNMQLG